MTNGFFLVSRALTDPRHYLHPMSTSEAACSAFAWIDLIGYARWSEGGGLDRGDLRASVRFLAGRWNWNVSRVSRFLQRLEDEGMILRKQQKKNQASIISICNYDTYQHTFIADEGGSRNSKRHSKRHSNAHKEERRSKKEELPIGNLWDVYLSELGGDKPHPSLTDERRKKLSALYSEQLADEDDPAQLFRRILWAVKSSDHHMSNRDYQMPESLFVNATRRDRWATKGRKMGRPSSSGPGYVSRDMVE